MYRTIRTISLAGLLLQAGAQAAILHYTTPLGLSGSQEVPARVTPASGTGSLSYDTATLLLDVSLSWADLLAPASAGHIHCCSGPGANGPVAVDFGSAGFPIGAISGIYGHTFDLALASSFGGGFLGSFGGDVDAARGALLAGLSANAAYFNIHTQVFPGGEIRGNIVQTALPQPGTLALLGIGFVVAAFGWRRRHHA